MTVLTLILAGGPGSALSILSAERPKPAQPFGGKYRIIDFVLSNVANSGLDRVAVLAQFHPLPLMRHIGAGRPWDLDRNPPRGVQMWLPGLAGGGQTWYRGTADALEHNRTLIAESACDRLLILPADHVTKQDYRALLRFHDEKGAELTISTTHVPPEEAHRFGIIAVDADQRVTAFTEKPEQAHSALASMGIYVFNTDALLGTLSESTRDLGRDLIPRMVVNGKAYAYPFRGAWADIGTVQSYWETNLALLDDPQGLADADVGADPGIGANRDWPIVTRAEPRPPAWLGAQSVVHNALLSDGCVILGTVEHSVLSPGVKVEAGAVVRDTVIMADTIVGAGALVDRCVVDEAVRIGPGAQVGIGNAIVPNHLEPDHLNTGITLVGKGAHIPENVVIGRNCRIDPHTTDADYQQRDVPSGATVSVRQT
ncbi:MAG: glucose-1-phosphate adenylyltransferase [Anaerolineae bacterium]|nr:glucose-1-phosphate adenylyltransferase [Anaerolineae bacterium]